uniref:Putative tam3-transposase ac family n=1 Tax=Xenopsylla cheopis TaxID=163159 RepID=A0A6M2DI23_XENCH
MSSRVNSSVLWDYFVKDNINKKGKCLLCGELYSYKSSTGNLKTHLRKKHREAYLTVETLQAPTSKWEPIEHDDIKPLPVLSLDMLNNPANTSQVKQEANTIDMNVAPFQDDIDRDLMDLFIDSYQPFTLVEERAFKKFCSWIPGYKLPSCKTITKKLLPDLYEATQTSVDKWFDENSIVKSCITLDMWTSSSFESYLSVTAHYITEDLELKSVLLKCSYIQDPNTPENFGVALLCITNFFDLCTKINFVVSDNLVNVQEMLDDMDWQHYACYAFSLNNIIKNGLQVVDSKLHKLKQIVRSFEKKPFAREKLAKAQTSDAIKELIQEVPTRWNSCYDMLVRWIELESYLRPILIVKDYDFPVISEEEWKLYAELVKVLKPFEEVAKCMRKEKYMPASLVIVVTRCLITSLDNLLQESFSSDAKSVIETLKSGLETRFSDVEKSEVFSICTFLDPRYKKSVFSNQQDAKAAEKRIQNLIISFTKQDTSEEELEEKYAPGDKFSPWSILKDIVHTQQSSKTTASRAAQEIEKYLSDDILPVFDENGTFNCPVKWWRNHRYTYPNLARLFREYGNIMVTSVPCERIFSENGHIINDRRTRITSHKVRHLAYLNANLDPERFDF